MLQTYDRDTGAVCVPYAGQDTDNYAPSWAEVRCYLCTGFDNLVPHRGKFMCVWCKDGKVKPMWALAVQRMPGVP